MQIDTNKKVNLNKIQRMKLFKKNWNGCGGLAFTPSAIMNFYKIIDNLKIQPDIAPTGRNSLLMQYELADNSYLAFEVFSKKISKLFIPQGNKELAVSEEISNSDYKNLNNIVSNFMLGEFFE